jgi:hypothetical protein
MIDRGDGIPRYRTITRMIGSYELRWGWLVVGLATACVVDDKGVGVEDTEDGSSGRITEGESSETTGVSSVSASSSMGTGETGTGESTGGTTTTATDSTDDRGTEESTDGTTGEPFDLPCGDALFCTGGDVCIETAFPPECEALPDGEVCPPEQEMTQCGGIGFACCCDPPPPSQFDCVAPVDCVGPATCECLGDVCMEGFECIAQGVDPEHVFLCERPPVP